MRSCFVTLASAMPSSVLPIHRRPRPKALAGNPAADSRGVVITLSPNGLGTAAILRRLEPTWSLHRSPTLEVAFAGRGTCLDLRPSAAT
jgi:hypothetical protein